MSCVEIGCVGAWCNYYLTQSELPMLKFYVTLIAEKVCELAIPDLCFYKWASHSVSIANYYF